ncbi:hypothetical protein AOQ84DRAFT_359404 [Glonium stellatum]|uniref:Uncharacterized protein n=1 Tax=Glonium stellatum TaxID=574774 RepID=A0A8E2FCD1_9PEZI|nr:hypothetical protein AOQ84DRAFT_359404 [Glonium stellatum]
MEGRSGITDMARENQTRQLRPGTGAFMITSSEVLTFSVHALIVIPTVTIGMVLLSLLLRRFPNPWRSYRGTGGHYTGLAAEEGQVFIGADEEDWGDYRDQGCGKGE